MCCTVTAQWAAEWFQIATLNVLWRFSCQFCKKIKGLVLGFHISYCFRATETDCVWVLFWSIHALNGYLLRLVTYPMQKPKLWKRGGDLKQAERNIDSSRDPVLVTIKGIELNGCNQSVNSSHRWRFWRNTPPPATNSGTETPLRPPTLFLFQSMKQSVSEAYLFLTITFHFENPNQSL